MSLILRTATRGLVPVILVFAIFIMLRGHNSPGGGFIGGMVAGGAFALYLLTHDVSKAREAVPVPPQLMVAAGLATALASGLPSLWRGEPFLTGIWAEWHVPAFGKVAVGTPLLFDLGVFILVTGMVLTILFQLAEEA